MYSTINSQKLKIKTPKASVSKNLLDKLVDVCSADIRDFGGFPKIETILNPVGSLYYLNNNASILGVGHLDSVMESQPIIKKSKKGNWTCRCPQLDDRLGVWVLLYVLPQLGITTDILLTDEEESGNSTAKWFDPPKDKKYNWIFEFDRRGTDVVMYQYKTDYSEKLMEENDFRVGWGSFSDIVHLDNLNVLGFNFGTGYYNEHTLNCYANLSHTLYMVRKFVKFFNTLSTVKMDFDKNDSIRRYYSGQSYVWDAYDYTGHCYGAREWSHSEQGFQHKKTNTEPINGNTSSEEEEIREWHDQQEKNEIKKQKRRQRGVKGTPHIHPSQLVSSDVVGKDAWILDPETGEWVGAYDDKPKSLYDDRKDMMEYKCEICGEYFPNEELTVKDRAILCVFCANAYEIASVETCSPEEEEEDLRSEYKKWCHNIDWAKGETVEDLNKQ